MTFHAKRPRNEVHIKDGHDRADFKVTIPRSLIELMELEPKRFGFTDPELQERLRAGVFQRKASVMRRQPGGISGKVRGPNQIFTNGRYSPYSGEAVKHLNTDPAFYKKGPVLRPRDLAEAKEIFEVLYRGLVYQRMRGSDTQVANYHRIVGNFRSECLIPMWAEVAGVFLYAGDAYLDALEKMRQDVDAWMDKVRRDAKALVSEFEQDYAGLPDKLIKARATAYLMVPRVMVGLSWFWADDPIQSLAGEEIPDQSVWDHILNADQHIRKGVTVPMRIDELREFSFRLNLMFDHVMQFEEDSVSASDWEGLLKANHLTGIQLKSFEDISR